MNTSAYIPFDSVASILLVDPNYPDYPFFSGTGFLSHFPPYKDIFFITAKHCVLDSLGNEKGRVFISLANHEKNDSGVPLDGYFLAKASQEEKDYEDMLVYAVSERDPDRQRDLFRRSLPLQSQDLVESLLQQLQLKGGRLRTVGFPSQSKDINYEKRSAAVQPRGFHGTVAKESRHGGWYSLENLSWQEGDLSGFSGSPVIEFLPGKYNNIIAFPIGVVTTGSSKIVHFLSISFVTDAIAKYLLEKDQLVVNPAE